MSDSCENNRLKIYKNKGKDSEELRRKRTETSIELRKAKKEDQLLKKRNVNVDALSPTSPLQEKQQNVPQIMMSMAEIAKGINSSDPVVQMTATQCARKILSREKHPPIQDFINSGLLPRLVQFLEHNDRPELQFEAAWALTNVASGDSQQTRAVVCAGAATKFIKLLSSPHENVCEQAVWAIGNIAGDGPELRDSMIDAGVVEPLLALIVPTVKDVFLRNVAWTISNLCRNKNPPPPAHAVSMCLPALATLLGHGDKDVLGDTCWALSYLTDGSNDRIQMVVDAGVVPRLIELLYHSEPAIVTPSLRAIGNIVTGSDFQTQTVIEAPGALEAFHVLLRHPKNNVQKEAAWALSNVTAGNVNQIQAVVDANLIPDVVDVMKNGDYKSQKEAAWVITNLTSGGNVDQISYVVQCGVIPHLCDLLLVNDSKVVLVTLDAFNNILTAAGKVGAQSQVCIMIEEAGGVEKLEALQEHENEEVYKQAIHLIDAYFFDDGEDEDSAVAPSAASDGTGFEFTQDNGVPDSGFSF